MGTMKKISRKEAYHHGDETSPVKSPLMRGSVTLVMLNTTSTPAMSI
jgi:hypothetical protein